VIGVLLVDDHALIRRGLSELIATAEGINVVGAIEDGELAAAAVVELEPDIVLMDMSMQALTASTRPAPYCWSGHRPRSSC